DHGCEYMTGGTVVVLGATGRNFAAGMSGGIAYVLDEVGRFRARCNLGMIELEKPSDEDARQLRELIEEHLVHTASPKAKRVLDAWAESLAKFVKVMPVDYKRVLEARRAAERAAVRRRTQPAMPSGAPHE
ncbi:MAG: hypothetical protein HY075_02880, partial [Deltaproteobacteria bacterium]|nr:hypothetical protein [Deltaproteobacteria bacterium]